MDAAFILEQLQTAEVSYGLISVGLGLLLGALISGGTAAAAAYGKSKSASRAIDASSASSQDAVAAQTAAGDKALAFEQDVERRRRLEWDTAMTAAADAHAASEALRAPYRQAGIAAVGELTKRAGLPALDPYQAPTPSAPAGPSATGEAAPSPFRPANSVPVPAAPAPGRQSMAALNLRPAVPRSRSADLAAPAPVQVRGRRPQGGV